MNVDRILEELNQTEADYILIGGMNFLLRHMPELTFDVDVWVADTEENLRRVNEALRRLGGEWGPTEADWKPVPADWSWLRRQAVFCLTTAHGALDVFRDVLGLEGRYQECKAASVRGVTGSGVVFQGLSDRHMLECQLALPNEEQKENRVRMLRRALANGGQDAG